ncbi:MAG: cytochrome c oxidase assembly protein, partial [Actinomycetota bacterium]
HGLHAAEHLTFFGTALAFWALVIGGPSGRRLGHPAAAALVLFTAAHSGALGAILSFASRGLYPVHSGGAAAVGLTLLEDQQLAGAIMWIPAGAVYLITIVVLMVRALSALEKAGLEGAAQ